GRAIPTPFGDVYSSNLTGSREHGLGQWSFEDFRRAMREGVAPDGRVLSPAFPYTSFTRMREDDLEALFAYLQTLAPVEQANRLGGQADPESLVGARLPDGWYAPDLRDAAWTAAGSAPELAEALMTGRSESGWAAGPMVEVVSMGTSHLRPEDALAIASYLVEDAVPRANEPVEATPHPATLSRGEGIYRDRCADCHGDDGQGEGARAPALAGNPGVRSAIADNMLRVILEGGYGAQTAENPRPY